MRSYSSRNDNDEARPAARGGLLRLVLTVLVLAWAIRSFLAALFSIPSGSMLPALFVGDYVLVAKWPYGYSRYSFPLGFPSFEGRILAGVPERGDVVVFRPTGENSDFVKRVIGLPGDTIEVEGGMLRINGRAVPRQSDGFAEVPVSQNSPCRVVGNATRRLGRDGSTCLYPIYIEALPNGRSFLVIDQIDHPTGDHFGPTVVPDGHLFLMGDNRDDSLDSRYSPAQGGVGFVPLENLVGRATVVVWSTDGSAHYLKPWTWFSAARSDRIGRTFSGAER